MNEFFVGRYRVDMFRSQIVAEGDIMSMEPKVLQVLLILAENQGQVVAHETLLTKVWPDVVVAPNALQRCIAQLRKAFGDDAKSQQVIATHPKVGYSLLADVDWRDTSLAIQAQPRQEPQPQPRLNTTAQQALLGRQPWFAIVSLALLVCVVLLSLFADFNRAPVRPPLAHLTPLTTTDHKEFSPRFSPDGRYIAFARFSGVCKRHLWAKDLIENREYRLTKEAGVYGAPEWSPDSKKLVFFFEPECREGEDYHGCRDLRTLPFALAKGTPQQPQTLLACDQHDYGYAQWMNNSDVVFMQRKAGNNEVMRYHGENGDTSVLYASDEHQPYALSYSTRQQQLVISQHDKMHKSSMVLFDGISGQLSQVALQFPPLFKYQRRWEMSWHPTLASLIVSAGDTLFEVSLDGQFTEYAIPTMQNIYSPRYHPDGKRIAAIMGIFDSDVGLLEWPNKHSERSKTQQSIVHRSIVEDYGGQFRPGSDDIAFISERSGHSQVWLTQGEQVQQLSHLAKDVSLHSFVWSADGQIVVMVANDKLHLVNLDGQTQVHNTPFNVVDVYQWVGQQQVLLAVTQNNQQQVMLWDVASGQQQILYHGFTHWAQMSLDDRLFMIDVQMRAMQVIDGKAQLIEALADIEIGSKILYKDGQLVLFNPFKKLWLYEPVSAHLTTLKLPNEKDRVWSIDDLDLVGGRMLYSWADSARKEIVMFHQ